MLSVRGWLFAIWLVAFARVIGGALVIWAFNAPSWAIAGWLLANIDVRLRRQAPKSGTR